MSRFDKKFKRRANRVHYKIRSKLFGKLRLSVFRSERHIYAQIIDDAVGRTLCSASTVDAAFRGTGKTSNCDASRRVGEMLAGRAKDIGINEVVFDRGGYNYHGRVKALADGAHNGGLLF
ncbi:MAG: 50S ribosomal protein L18 [Holosporaceae bacterium]|jgi:large subunit ribosomal protein L18|nr:50S ribosomal protein L18 [Holosporaceae bacterium]